MPSGRNPHLQRAAEQGIFLSWPYLVLGNILIATNWHIQKIPLQQVAQIYSYRPLQERQGLSIAQLDFTRGQLRGSTIFFINPPQQPILT